MSSFSLENWLVGDFGGEVECDFFLNYSRFQEYKRGPCHKSLFRSDLDYLQPPSNSL